MEKVSCDVCGKKFDNEDALKQHKNDAHKQAVVSEVKKTKITKGKIIAIMIPLLIFGSIGYGIFWYFAGNHIGNIGSTHIHADFAIFLEGKEITPLPSQFYTLSPYIHVEQGPGAGSVIHMHATNVPLKMFFESMSMELTPNCFIVSTTNKYCNDGYNSLKMFVKHVNGTWEQNFEYGKYVFLDLDKILITYGNESSDQIKLQQLNITDFAKENTQVVLGR